MSCSWLFLSVALARPSGPVAAPASTPDAAGAALYLQTVMPQIQSVFAPLRAELAAVFVLSNAAHAEARKATLCQGAAEATDRLTVLSPFPTDDAVREAALGFVDRLKEACDDDLARWLALRRPIVEDSDLDEALQLGPALEQRLRAEDDAYFDAVASFATRHGVKLSLQRPAPRSPWVPPAPLPDDREPAQITAQLSAAYIAQLGPANAGLRKAWFDWKSAVVEWKGAGETTRGTSRDTVGRAKTAVQRIAPWQGDDLVRSSTLILADAITQALDGPGAEAAKRSVAGPQSQRDVDAIKALLAEADAKVDPAFESLLAAEALFRERWGVVAYEAWTTSLAP